MSQLPNTTTTSNRASKRMAFDEFGKDAEKMMTHHQSIENQPTATVPKSFDELKFVSAAIVTNCTATNVQTRVEMTDDEIHAYTIEFEKKHPQ